MTGSGPSASSLATESTVATLRRYFETDIAARIKWLEVVRAPVATVDSHAWSGRCAAEHKFEIARRIAVAGSNAFLAIRHMTENGITVATALIPGCDRFFLVASGLIVLPSRRLLAEADRCRTAE